MSYIPLPKETFSQAVPTIASEHRYIHMGEVFRYFDAVTINSGSSQDYLLTTPVSPYPHLIINADGAAITSFFLFEATDKSGTTLQSTYNANRNSATVSGMTVKKSTSGGTTDGTQLMTYSSGTAQGNSRSPASLDYSAEWVLKPSTKYIIRITSGTAGNLCNIMLEWYEHVSGT